jgi:cysteine desulfurase/selenocysteine lyase
MRDNFPFFARNPAIIYLDTAATSQALYTVIEDQTNFSLDHRSNSHRSGHSMGTWVDQKYFRAKELIAKYVNVKEPEKTVIFNSGSSQGLNDAVKLVEQAMPGGTIYLGIDAHHSLSLPLMELCKSNPWWNIKYIPLNSEGCLDLTSLEQWCKEDKESCRIIAVSAVSNILGKINDLDKIRDIAHATASNTIIDASQLVGKRAVNFHGFDFVAWSWHKVYGPMGLGTLIIDPVWLNYAPVHPGGGSVSSVTISQATWQSNAGRFESGTLNLSAIATLPRLIEWLIANESDIVAHDKKLARIANSNVSETYFNTASNTDTGLISLLPAVGAVEDYTMMLDARGVMVRSGKLCAQPLIDSITNNRSLLRLSWGCYTDTHEVEIAFDYLGEIYGRLSRNVR